MMVIEVILRLNCAIWFVESSNKNFELNVYKI